VQKRISGRAVFGFLRSRMLCREYGGADSDRQETHRSCGRQADGEEPSEKSCHRPFALAHRFLPMNMSPASRERPSGSRAHASRSPSKENASQCAAATAEKPQEITRRRDRPSHIRCQVDSSARRSCDPLVDDPTAPGGGPGGIPRGRWLGGRCREPSGSRVDDAGE
jgi:hypothetical protein